MWEPQGVNVFCTIPMVIPMQPIVPLSVQLHSTPQLPPEFNQPISASNEDVSDADTDDEECDEESRTLFCANLDEQVTEELLYEVFLQAGPVDVVRIPKDNQGKQRSFGFVTFVHPSAAPYAMQLYQGLELFRKRITIRFRNSERIPPNPFTLPLGLETQFGNRSNRIANVESNEVTNKIIAVNINPFSQDLRNSLHPQQYNNNELPNRLGRNSYHGAKPYDRPEEPRRRSDGMVDRAREREWDRNRGKNYYTPGYRRPDQRSGQRR